MTDRPDRQGGVWLGRDLPPIVRDGVEYFLLSADEALFLVPNVCPHRGGPLKFGYLNEAGRLVCPMHGNAFSVESLLANPLTLKLSEGPSTQDGPGDGA